MKMNQTTTTTTTKSHAQACFNHSPQRNVFCCGKKALWIVDFEHRRLETQLQLIYLLDISEDKSQKPQIQFLQ